MQKSSPIRLIRPNISQLEIEAAAKVLESGMLVSGPKVEQFEKRLAEYLSVPNAVCVSSGTAALHLSLLVADVNSGDDVLVPAFTFPATANVVEMIGARPVFVDCRPGSVNIDVEQIEKNLSVRARAVMPVHVFGIPSDMNEIIELARKKNLVVIEDAACALGSKYKEKHCGSIGDLAAFSFHPRKLLTTGEGGAVVTHDKITADKIKSLRNHGWESGEYRRLGYNYRMTDFQATLGIGQMGYYDRRLSKRRYLAKKYWDAIKTIEWLEPVMPNQSSEWNVQTLLVKVNAGVDRDDLIKFLNSEGIESTIGTYCVPLTYYYRLKYGYTSDEYPNAFDMFKRTISLPLHNKMNDDNIKTVCKALYKYSSKLKQIMV